MGHVSGRRVPRYRRCLVRVNHLRVRPPQGRYQLLVRLIMNVDQPKVVVPARHTSTRRFVVEEIPVQADDGWAARKIEDSRGGAPGTLLLGSDGHETGRVAVARPILLSREEPFRNQHRFVRQTPNTLEEIAADPPV